MGVADLIPGVSGGTIALLLNIYEQLLQAIGKIVQSLSLLLRGDISNTWEHARKIEWGFLIPLVAGILIAVFTLSSILNRLLTNYPEEMAGVFFGLVLAAIIISFSLLKQRDLIRISAMVAIAIITFLVLGLQSGPISNPSILVYFGSGMIAICAMILPGISGSFLLLMIGMYPAVLEALHERIFTDLIVFIAGLIAGIILFSSALNWLLNRAYETILAVLIGLMIGSLRVLWPWPQGVGSINDKRGGNIDGTELGWPASGEIIWPVLLAIAAFTVVVTLKKLVPTQERENPHTT